MSKHPREELDETLNKSYRLPHVGDAGTSARYMNRNVSFFTFLIMFAFNTLSLNFNRLQS